MTHFEADAGERQWNLGISIAFANMDLRMVHSSPDNEVAESDFAMAEGGCVSGSASFFSAGTDDGLPPN